jgi:predicted transcriptional regulator
MAGLTPNKFAARWTVARIKKRNPTMKTYEFSIIASGLDPRADDFESRFYDAGCDDALVSFQKGHIIIDFARESESIDDAVASAIESVRAAGATVDRIEPDPLVSLSEIASRTGVTRAAVSMYASGRRADGFPAPVAKVTDESPLWNWASVARWFVSRHKLAEDALIEAEVVSEANAAIACNEPNMRERLKNCAQHCHA